eukprot:TRINITY_DN8541_c0_g2_i2.p1 TRINITY_DN8541_c0_g2~~TRINITY_DN8541_c0_g2_i2.p1  ORF type:complete len:1032 (+),score=93.13 TRINITY_DN8541_c0_g2_i2:45-3140(+)
MSVRCLLAASMAGGAAAYYFEYNLDGNFDDQSGNDFHMDDSVGSYVAGAAQDCGQAFLIPNKMENRVSGGRGKRLPEDDDEWMLSMYVNVRRPDPIDPPMERDAMISWGECKRVRKAHQAVSVGFEKDPGPTITYALFVDVHDKGNGRTTVARWFALGEWYHVVVRYTGGRDITVYINPEKPDDIAGSTVEKVIVLREELRLKGGRRASVRFGGNDCGSSSEGDFEIDSVLLTSDVDLDLSPWVCNDGPGTASPSTPSPRTLAPSTPAPPTAVPVTLSPPTTVPATPSPRTVAPPTSSPVTPSPVTGAPLTPAPATPAPITAAPATPAPITAAPATPAPITAAPATPAPITKTSTPPTSAPLTPSPETPAPRTRSPRTKAPPTPALTMTPKTRAPRTPLPLRARFRPEPPTAVPLTASPPSTPAPRTPMSQTPARPTPEPSTTAPIPVGAMPLTPAPTHLGVPEETKEKLRSVGRGASAASIVAGPAAGQAGKLAIVRSFGCDMDDVDLGYGEPLDFEFSPTGVALGDSRVRYLLGAVVMNIVLFVGCGVASLAITFAVHHCSTGISWGEALGRAKTPGMLLIPFAFLLPGTSLAACRLLFFPTASGVQGMMVGVIGLAFCIAGPSVMYKGVLARIPSSARAEMDEAVHRIAVSQGKGAVLTGKKRAAYLFVFGDRIWVPHLGDPQFCEKYGLVFDSYKEGHSWLLQLEMAVTLLLSLFSVWKPGSATECAVRNMVITLLLLAFFVVLVVTRPFLAPLDNVVAVALSGTMALAVLVMSVAIGTDHHPEGWLFVLSGQCLLLGAYLVMVKAVWDILLYAYDVWAERKASAREAERAARDQPPLMLPNITEMCEVDNLSEGEARGDVGVDELLQYSGSLSARAAPQSDRYTGSGSPAASMRGGRYPISASPEPCAGIPTPRKVFRSSKSVSLLPFEDVARIRQCSGRGGRPSMQRIPDIQLSSTQSLSLAFSSRGLAFADSSASGYLGDLHSADSVSRMSSPAASRSSPVSQGRYVTPRAAASVRHRAELLTM